MNQDKWDNCINTLLLLGAHSSGYVNTIIAVITCTIVQTFRLGIPEGPFSQEALPGRNFRTTVRVITSVRFWTISQTPSPTRNRYRPFYNVQQVFGYNKCAIAFDFKVRERHCSLFTPGLSACLSFKCIRINLSCNTMHASNASFLFPCSSYCS